MNSKQVDEMVRLERLLARSIALITLKPHNLKTLTYNLITL